MKNSAEKSPPTLREFSSMENHPGIFLAFEIATNNSQNV
jgi:hypothetical protein